MNEHDQKSITYSREEADLMFGALPQNEAPPTRIPFDEKTTPESALRLVRLLDGVRAAGFERSFKLLGNRLLTDRFVLGVRRADLSNERLAGVCRSLDMPREMFERFKGALPEATQVLFGFEDGETTAVYKVYVEYWDRVLSTRPADGREPFLSHKGFKWDANDPSKSMVADYICTVHGTWQAIDRGLDAYYGPVQCPSRTVIGEALRAAKTRLTPERVLYLEVTEPGNSRRSIDMALHAAGLPVQSIALSLEKAAKEYGIPERAFAPLLEAVTSCRLGHLAGGVDREGRDFLSIYYEELE